MREFPSHNVIYIHKYPPNPFQLMPGLSNNKASPFSLMFPPFFLLHFHFSILKGSPSFYLTLGCSLDPLPATSNPSILLGNLSSLILFLHDHRNLIFLTFPLILLIHSSSLIHYSISYLLSFPFIALRNLISPAWSLLQSLFIIFHMSFPYNTLGI